MAVDTTAPTSPAWAGDGESPHGAAKQEKSADYRIGTWIRNVGAVILLFVAFQLWGTGVQERRDQLSLKKQFETLVHAGAGAPIPVGSAVAHLQIPRIGLDEYVVEGTDRRRLEEGPGHYVNSPLPGQHGNVDISGHRTSYGAPFNHLDKLRVGDVILAATRSGTFKYVVSGEPASVPPSDGAVLNDQGDDRLTLSTCTPPYSATDRLIVTARLVGAASTSGQAQPVTGGRVTNDHDGWQWGQAPIAAVLASALIALGLSFRRIRSLLGGVAAWLVLTPVWAVGLLLLFERVGQLLPANL